VLGWATRGRAGDLGDRLHVGIGNSESAEMGHTVRRLAEHARSHAAVGAALGRPVDECWPSTPRRRAVRRRPGAVRLPHRAELELAQPTWRQDPRQLLDLVAREYARPSEAAETAQSTRRQAEADLRAEVPAFARLPIRLAAARVAAHDGVRENAKAPAVLIFDELRRVLEVAGPLLAARGVIADPATRSTCATRAQRPSWTAPTDRAGRD